jgi:hypothetical protein
MTALDVWAALCLVVVALAGRAAWCNLRRARDAWGRAPLDGIDLHDVGPREVSLPRGWPAFATLADPATAYAYAVLARQRAAQNRVFGEVATVFGGAVVGAALPKLPDLKAEFVAGGGLFLAAYGGVTRLTAGLVWERVHGAYEARYELLTRAEAERPAPRPGLLERLLGR